MGLGILPTASELVSVVQNAMPPEHRIVGERQEDFSSRVYFLIEGPSLPECAADEMPITLTMVVTMVDGHPGWRAYWLHAPDVTWPVEHPDPMPMF
jgi:hypothetical protein